MGHPLLLYEYKVSSCTIVQFLKIKLFQSPNWSLSSLLRSTHFSCWDFFPNIRLNLKLSILFCVGLPFIGVEIFSGPTFIQTSLEIMSVKTAPRKITGSSFWWHISVSPGAAASLRVLWRVNASFRWFGFFLMDVAPPAPIAPDRVPPQKRYEKLMCHFTALYTNG